MDEPFGAVDPIVRSRLQEEFRELQQDLAKTVVLVTHDIDEAVFLGSKVAVLDIGGRLEQFDAPEAVLADPASGFVEAFLGGERGLKRLALRPVSRVEMTPGPVVDVTSTVEEARSVMQAHRVDWVGLIDGDRLLGWAHGSELGSNGLASAEPKPFLVTLRPDSSLREALDAVVTSRARVAVVVDEGRYLGMLDLESIAREITQ